MAWFAPLASADVLARESDAPISASSYLSSSLAWACPRQIQCDYRCAAAPISAHNSPSSTPSFPRKRESRRLQPSPPPEIKYKQQSSDPFLPLWEKARMNARRVQARLCGRDARAPRDKPAPVSVLFPRHSRESGNPDDRSQASHPKSSTNSSQRIPSPFMGEG